MTTPRSREELMELTKREGWGYSAEAILEVLLDIRDELKGVVSKADVLAARNPLTPEEVFTKKNPTDL